LLLFALQYRATARSDVGWLCHLLVVLLLVFTSGFSTGDHIAA
jgi:hypothetical protein